MVEVDLDPAQLREFGDFSKNNRGDAPGFIGEQGALAGRQIVDQRIK